VDPTQFCVYSTRTDLERIVEGEQRYWVHPPSLRFGEAGVAIDRFTGQVIDKQIEVVNE
jgi:hypothetical protein